MEREGCSGCKSLKIPGICFVPSDEVLVAYYLKNKIEGRPLQCNHLITELKIYDDVMMPWEVLKDDNPYWITSCNDSSKNKIKKTIYVYTELRKKKSRVIRRSGRGSWTGQNNSVVKDKAGNDIGFNKLLTFYEDNDDKKGKKGNKKMISTDDDDEEEEHGNWIMHEYSLIGIDNYVLCKIIKMNAKASILMCPTKAAATQDFHTQGDEEITNVVLDDERQLGGGDQTLDWEYNGWMEELYHQLDENICDVKELAIDGQEDVQIPNFLVEEEEAIDVVYQPSGADLEINAWNTVGSVGDHNQTGSMSDDTSAAVGVGGVQELPVVAVMDNWQDILDFSLGETVAQEVSTVAVCEKNGQRDDSYKDVQIPNFLVEEEAIDVVYQQSNDSGADLGVYGEYGSVDDTSAGVGGVQELPVVAVMDIWQDNLNFSLLAQEVSVAVCGKNGQSDDSYKGLDGAGNHDIIIIDDDSCTGVDQVQEVVMIEAEDAPQIQAINVDNQEDNHMEGNKQIIDDFWNFELVGADHAVSPTNTAWDDVILDFSSPELFDLWGDETNERSIFEGQSQKRMRYGEEDWEECPSGKTQRCL